MAEWGWLREALKNQRLWCYVPSLFLACQAVPDHHRRTPGFPADLFRGLRAPTLVIGLARLLAVWRRPDHHVDLGLLVALDRGLLRTAVFLAPEKRQLGAGLRILLLDEAKREHLAFVEAVAGEHRGAGRLAAAQDRVERARGVIRERDVDELVVLAGWREHRGEYLRHIRIVPRECHLLAVTLALHRLQRLLA